MKRLKVTTFFLVSAIWFLVTMVLCSYADIPRTINYQGKLTDKQGYALTGSYNITFRLYDAPTGGNLLWQESHTNVSVSKGLFSVILGAITPLNLPFDKQYYLSIQVGADPEMAPRQALASAPYAFTAESGVPRGVIVMWSGTISNIPSGWALCDGTNGTPDLRNRFIIGAKQDDGGLSKTDITGNFTKNGGLITHTHAYSGRTGTPSHQGGGNTDYLPATDEHTHAYSGTTDSASSLPPYYALAYIMKL